MEYVITYATGEQAYLAHYGVKGMKWGSWNAETRAKYADAGNGTYYRKAERGDKYGRSVTNARRAYNARQPKWKQAAKVALLGVGGAHAYNTARSRGLSRGDAVINAKLGPIYAQGVKHKQRKSGTTNIRISKSAKIRSDYANKQSDAKDIIKTGLGGALTVSYNTIKANTKSRGKAVVGTLLAGAANYVVPGAAYIPQAYYYNKHKQTR